MIAAMLTVCLLCQTKDTGDAVPAPAATDALSRAVFLRGLERMEATDPDELLAEVARFAAEELAGIRPTPVAERQHRRDVLMGLSTLFDATGVLEKHPLTRSFFRGVVQTEEERIRRSQIGGWVRFHGRNDAVRHFFVSAALCTLAGPVIAERAGRSKEIQDARSRAETGTGQGFSFTDLAYNHAGIRYASRLLGWPGKHHLEAPPVPLDAFVPQFEELDLPENLDWPTFQERYYGDNWSEYRRLVARVHERIEGSVQARVGDRDSDAGTASDAAPESDTEPAPANPDPAPETDTGAPDRGL